MRVGDPDERQEMPEECDACGSLVELKRFYHYGPGDNVEWLCPYCAASFFKESDTSRTMAGMFHVLEKRLRNKE
jgi:hypothetical protein